MPLIVKQFPVTFSSFDLSISLSTLLSNTFSLRPCCNMRGEVSKPYKTAEKTVGPHFGIYIVT